MKHIIRYQNLLITNKLRIETKLVIDDARTPDYTSIVNGESYTSIRLYPWITISIVRANETDESGNRVRGVWNPNDSIGLTTYTLPIFIDYLSGIYADLKIPDLYKYTNSRLELSDETAEKIRRVFMVGNTTIELSAVVITQPDESKVEGIKMKFNNEQSTVMLTLNDLESMTFKLKTIDLDSLSMMLFDYYSNKKPTPTRINNTPEVDISPVMSLREIPEFKEEVQ